GSSTRRACALALRSIAARVSRMGGIERAPPELAHPGEDRGERGTELVRGGGEELVLQAVRLFRPAVQLRRLDSDADPVGDDLGDPSDEQRHACERGQRDYAAPCGDGDWRQDEIRSGQRTQAGDRETQGRASVPRTDRRGADEEDEGAILLERR